MFVSTARPGVEAATLEKAILEHLERAASEPPAAADFERSRHRMLTEFYSGLQKLDNRADMFSQFTTYFDDPGGVAREADRYLEIEPRELTGFAAAHLSEDQRVVVTVVPRAAS
jgi:predicted Zn-dependent peptidase